MTYQKNIYNLICRIQ